MAAALLGPLMLVVGVLLWNAHVFKASAELTASFLQPLVLEEGTALNLVPVGELNLLRTWKGKHTTVLTVLPSASKENLIPGSRIAATSSYHFDAMADNIINMLSLVRAGPDHLQRFRDSDVQISVSGHALFVGVYRRLSESATSFN
jgi:hypothetical protein